MGRSGSATLINRVKRHVTDTNKKKMHWHIDYFLQNNNTHIIKIYLIPCNQKIECKIAREIKNICTDSILNFGSSDCNCNSHLFYLDDFEYN